MSHVDDTLRDANVRLCRLLSWPNYVGLGFQLVRRPRPPHLVAIVESASPAAAGGLQINDVILAINGNDVTETNFRDLVAIVKVVQQSRLPMELLVVGCWWYETLTKKTKKGVIAWTAASVLDTPKIMPQEYRAFSRTVRRTCLMYLGTRDSIFGFDITPAYSGKGLFIRDVVPDSPAYRGGLRKCDWLIEIDGKNVENAAGKDITEKLKKAADHRVLKLTVEGTRIQQEQGSTLNEKSTDEEDTYVVSPARVDVAPETPRIHGANRRYSDNSLSVRTAPVSPATSVNEYNFVENDYLTVSAAASGVDNDYLQPSDDETTNPQHYYDANDCAALNENISANSTPTNQAPDSGYLEMTSIRLVIDEDKQPNAAFKKQLESIVRGGDARQANQRFLDVHCEQLVDKLPAPGYDQVPLSSLRAATEMLGEHVPKITQNARSALERSDRPADGLTPDESAAIQLYTTERRTAFPSFSTQLNAALRADNPNALTPYLPYLKLLLSALSKLQAVSGRVWRGARTDLREQYPLGRTFVWRGISSCLESCDLLLSANYLGSSGARTLFCIETTSGRSVRSHSLAKTETEVILLPATQLRVVQLAKQTDDVYIIYLKDVVAPCT